MKNRKSCCINRSRNSFLQLLLILALALVASGGWLSVAAQSSDDSWSSPVNLSQSGGATDPQLIVDSEGHFHVFWNDENVGFVYTNSEDGSEWTDPATVEMPSDEITPRIVSDADGSIHAFWIGDSTETTAFVPGDTETGTTGEDTMDDLFYSRVSSADFENSATWSARLMLSNSAVALDTALDANGNLHLVYIRTVDEGGFPAGLYYSQMEGGRGSWTQPVLLFESAYFRTLTPETAHVNIETASTTSGEQVYVVWDNRPRERVYFVKSIDAGETWSEPAEIDKPEEGSGAAGPANILVYAQGDEVLLLWQTGQTETSCNQYYQWSTDQGNNWQERQRMFENLLICPQDIQFFHGNEGRPILMVTAIQMFLQTWDGVRWSDPQLQNSLTSFVDPETQKLVDFSCQQGAMVGGTELYVVGCDVGPAKDIWIMKRQVLDTASWFPQDPVWSPPFTVRANEAELNFPVLIADADERVHTFWSQIKDPASGSLETAIFYSRWEAGQWSPPEAVLSSPEGKAGQPAAAVDPEGRLLVAWSGGQSGEIYFSQASAARAAVASTWSKPVLLPTPQPAGSAPDILVDHNGKIYVAYAIPLNEGRGIYLTSSTDVGVTWSEPIRIFDAVGAGWAMVDEPKLALTKSDNLHIIWSRYSLPSGPGSLGMYYARSEDGGLTWSEPQVVVEEAIGWAELVGMGERTVQRIWQEVSSGGTTLWHEQSVDDGLTWTRVSPVSIFGETVKRPSLTWDSAGRLHLLLIVSQSDESYVLQHWLWDGARWTSDRTLDLDSEITRTVSALIASISPKGNLSVMFAVKTGSKEAGDEMNHLLVTNRIVQLPLGEPTPPPIPQATPTVDATPVPTDLPILTPTPEGIDNPTPTADLNMVQPERRPTNLLWVVGSIFAGLMMLTVIIVAVVLVRSGRIQL